ncbi:MAG: DUF1295 domain-containing protein [Oceanicaulis sp.]
MDAPALLASNFAIIAAVFALLWAIAQLNRDPSFVDAFWAGSITLMALSSFVLADGRVERMALITGLTVLWGARLGVHLFTRWRREGADKRYEKLLSDTREKRGWSFARTTALFVFAPQAVLAWVSSLPVQLGQLADQPPLGWLAAAGAALALFGIAYETVADAQLARFKADPDNKGKVMDRGLWAWSRHPNYFGEALTWWGIWLVAAETTPGLFAVIGPVFVTFTLMKWSGAPMLERELRRSKPDYAAYIERTPGFFPRPPKRRPDRNV